MSFYDASKIKFLDPSEREIMRLFWRDDMENYATLKWLAAQAGTNLSYVNKDIPAFEGDYVLKMVNPNSTVSTIRTVNFGKLPLQINALEIRWWRPADLTSVFFALINNDGAGTRFEAAVQYHESGFWRYPTDSSLLNWANINGGKETITAESWNYLMLLFDYKNRQLRHIKTNSLSLKPLTHPIPTMADDGEGVSYIGVYAVLGHINDPFYLDDARIYLNLEV